MTQPSQGATNSVEAVAFSFLTDDEIRRSSRVKITSPILVDFLLHPVPDGLYDAALGPFDDKSLYVVIYLLIFIMNFH